MTTFALISQKLVLIFSTVLITSALAQTMPASPAQTQPAGTTSAAVCPPPVPPLTQAAIAEGLRLAQDHGPLWRIEKDGRASWLYGTIHIARLDWVFPGPNVINAMRNSDTLAVELNLFDAESLKPLSQPLDSAATDRILDAPRLERLAKQSAIACLPSAALNMLRPSMRAITLMVFNARNAGLYADYGLDIVLLGMAQRLKKPIVALESALEQAKLLSGTTETEEQEVVDQTLDAIESGVAYAQMQKLTSAWATQDLTTLSSYTDWCDCVKTPSEQKEMKRMLDDRNPAMAQKIALMHESGQRVFVGVGTLHMIGEQGLPALMQAKGYKVKVVNASTKP